MKKAKPCTFQEEAFLLNYLFIIIIIIRDQHVHISLNFQSREIWRGAFLDLELLIFYIFLFSLRIL